MYSDAKYMRILVPLSSIASWILVKAFITKQREW